MDTVQMLILRAMARKGLGCTRAFDPCSSKRTFRCVGSLPAPVRTECNWSSRSHAVCGKFPRFRIRLASAWKLPPLYARKRSCSWRRQSVLPEADIFSGSPNGKEKCAVGPRISSPEPTISWGKNFSSVKSRVAWKPGLQESPKACHDLMRRVVEELLQDLPLVESHPTNFGNKSPNSIPPQQWRLRPSQCPPPSPAHRKQRLLRRRPWGSPVLSRGRALDLCRRRF